MIYLQVLRAALSTASGNGTATLGNFNITTKYICAAANCEGAPGLNSPQCNDNHTVCIGGGLDATVDTGFLVVLNNGADFVGTISLRGNFIGTDNVSCPAGGNALDTKTFTTELPLAQNGNWTRTYNYNEFSPLEATKKSNR